MTTRVPWRLQAVPAIAYGLCEPHCVLAKPCDECQEVARDVVRILEDAGLAPTSVVRFTETAWENVK